MLSSQANLVAYHGTLNSFTIPDLTCSKGYKDFGPGFYLTTEKMQAENFALIQARRNGKSSGLINSYKISGLEGLTVKEFISPDAEWVKFVAVNRSVRGLAHGYDVAIGKVADDDTRETISRYLDGDYDEIAQLKGISVEDYVASLLMPEKLKNQLCFCTRRALERLQYITTSIVRR